MIRVVCPHLDDAAPASHGLDAGASCRASAGRLTEHNVRDVAAHLAANRDTVALQERVVLQEDVG